MKAEDPEGSAKPEEEEDDQEHSPQPASPSGKEANVPSGSINSLTPPPPTSDDPPNNHAADEGLDEGPEIPEASSTGQASQSQSGGTGQASEDWDTYRRHRGVRSFGVAAGENGEEDDDDETPKKSGPSRRSTRGGSQLDTLDFASPSEAGGSNQRSGRRRRGEEQLLMDDHLLPAELRAGRMTSRRGSTRVKNEHDPEEEEDVRVIEGKGSGSRQNSGLLDLEPEGHDQPKELDNAVEEAAEAEDEGDLGEEEKEDITRCICKQDGELYSAL